MRRPNEQVIIDARPHPVYALERSWRSLLMGVLSWGILVWVAGQTGLPWVLAAAWFVLAIAALRLLVGVLDWLTRRHLLTDQRVAVAFGILSRTEHEISRDEIRHSVVVRPIFERVFGLGTIGLSSAGTGTVEVVWRGVEHPRRVHDTIRGVDAPRPIPVIGIVGGIGSGKSTVARVFATLGCVVSDSDRAGAEALTRPEVVERLRRRWGESVVGEDGNADKGAIAARVFSDPEERAFLESVVHPIIHESRRELLARVRSEGTARGVIVDAPLLLEAGVDKECDAVVFVDTPRERRLGRVKSTRGWDEEELDRREKAQMPLEIKRERSDHVVVNGGNPDDLPHQAERILSAIEQRCRDLQSAPS